MELCACMGPRGSDPYCYCEMQRRNLPTSKEYEWTDEKKEEFKDILAEIFKWKKND